MRSLAPRGYAPAASTAVRPTFEVNPAPWPAYRTPDEALESLHQHGSRNAIAPHSGGTHDLSNCASQHKPVLIMHFEGDQLIPYKCGQQTRDRWVARNGCQLDAPDVEQVQGGKCEYYRGCPKDGQVAFCSFTIPMTGTRDELFAGHAWSGGSDTGSAGGSAFAIPETASATELGWTFFKTYAW